LLPETGKIFPITGPEIVSFSNVAAARASGLRLGLGHDKKHGHSDRSEKQAEGKDPPTPQF
jgi:hypothetical protein